MDQTPILQTISENNIMLQDHKHPGWYHVIWQMVNNAMQQFAYQTTQYHNPEHHILIFTALWTSNLNIKPNFLYHLPQTKL